ncbi:hypothetical protein [Actinotignum sp. GS-2025b]|uniref:hypothetical protein n=1 Tax=Actinotignum sp. GS-2025b TaxID=3427275 RepID=UPI003F459D4F
MTAQSNRLCFADRFYNSLEEVLERKEEILREVRMTREEFDLRADNYQLGPEEANAYVEMKNLDYFEEVCRGERTLGWRADEFAAHLQMLGELIDPEFSLSRQTVTKGDLPLKRLSGDIHVNSFLIVRFDYMVFVDQETGLLTVDNSMVSVLPGVKNSEPLVHWDYMGSPHSNIPCAHIHVHAHRGEWTHALVLGGTHSRRSRRRIKNEARAPRIADVHFPVGGCGFRPCLEEVLLFVIDEIGAECTPEVREALDHGIQKWEEVQLEAMVRANPALALEALEA